MNVLGLLLTLMLFLASVMVAADPVTDEAIYDQVRIKIATDRTVGGGKIEVQVVQGVVELTGTVKTDRQRDTAEKLAKKVKGVKKVENKLVVSPV